MKARALLFVCAVAAAAFASVQDSVQFARTYKQGDKDKYTIKVNTNMPMGAIDVTLTMSQEILKVYENGDADQKTSLTDMKVMMNGTDISQMAGGAAGTAGQGVTTRINKLGMPINKPKTQGGPMGGMSELIGLGAMLGDKPMKVGETIPINVVDPKDPKSKVTGTMKLESINEGVATIVAKIEVTNAQTTKPMKIASTSWVEIASSKPNKVEGTVVDLPAQQGMEIETVKFVMERVK